MSRVGRTLIILTLFCVGTSVSFADEIHVVGARKRTRPAEHTRIDVDDVIRAEGDPNFEQYLIDRENEKKLERTGALADEKKRQAEEDAYKKTRYQYLLKKRAERAKEAKQVKAKPPVDERKVWDEQQEKYRQEYVREAHKQRAKIRAQTMARLQKNLETLQEHTYQERMPASAQ